MDGTSASSPALAGLLALINDALIAQGSPTLGFLNPLLYSLGSNYFNDITLGSNVATESYPCLYGFPATAGWDAVSGVSFLFPNTTHNTHTHTYGMATKID